MDLLTDIRKDPAYLAQLTDDDATVRGRAIVRAVTVAMAKYRARQIATTVRPTYRSHAHVINSLPAVVQEPSMHMPATRAVSNRTRDATRKATLAHINAAVARLGMEDYLESQSGDDDIMQNMLCSLAQRNYNVSKKRELAPDRTDRAYSKPLDKSMKRCFIKSKGIRRETFSEDTV